MMGTVQIPGFERFVVWSREFAEGFGLVPVTNGYNSNEIGILVKAYQQVRRAWLVQADNPREVEVWRSRTGLKV